MNNRKKNKYTPKKQGKKRQGRKKVVNFPIQTSINYGNITKMKLQAISQRYLGASDSAVIRRSVDLLFDKEFGEKANVVEVLKSNNVSA